MIFTKRTKLFILILLCYYYHINRSDLMSVEQWISCVYSYKYIKLMYMLSISDNSMSVTLRCSSLQKGGAIFFWFQ